MGADGVQGKHKSLRSCAQCGKTFYGGIDCTKCPECARESRGTSVVRMRVCVDCGRSFEGGPRARRCPECRVVSRKEYARQRRGACTVRPLGSLDLCKICGREYTVESGRQKYCLDCRRDAVLAWQRGRKKEYSKRPETVCSRQERRKERKKICVYCLRPFWDGTPSNTCSDYCHNQHKKIIRCQWDIKRGRNRNLRALEDARKEYRDKVKAE